MKCDLYFVYEDLLSIAHEKTKKTSDRCLGIQNVSTLGKAFRPCFHVTQKQPGRESPKGHHLGIFFMWPVTESHWVPYKNEVENVPLQPIILSQIHTVQQRTMHCMKRKRSAISCQEIFNWVRIKHISGRDNSVKERCTVELVWTQTIVLIYLSIYLFLD